ncbi:hypothetical protein ATCC90586_012230 [Pythium insidiosum]|nr:hypothetical protein ATCC90586_012230 [Pythium insidiosum]
MPIKASDRALDVGVDGSMVWIVVGFVLLPVSVVFAWWGCLCLWKRRQDARAAAAGDVTEAARELWRTDVETVDASVPRAPLDLSGWRVQHAERVENEKLRLAGAGDVDVDVAIDWQLPVDEGEQERPHRRPHTTN